MPDMEKVMGWLNAVSTNPNWWDAYYSPNETKACAEAALAMLKEQDAVDPDCRICGQSHCKYYHETRKPTECKSYVRMEGW